MSNIPHWLRLIIYVLVAVVVIILFALVVHTLGGFDWTLKIGHFHMNIGVT